MVHLWTLKLQAMTFLKPVLILLLILAAFPVVYGQPPDKRSQNDNAANKELIKMLFEEIINKKNLAIFDQHFAKDVTDHSAFPDQLPGREGLKNSVRHLIESYPDIRVKIEEIIAEGDVVATRESWNATDKTSGIKKSGWVIHFFKIKDKVITDEWSKGWEWLH
jgi:predicted SnoaL-like aldol condensation-catalyzing enzyme